MRRNIIFFIILYLLLIPLIMQTGVVPVAKTATQNKQTEIQANKIDPRTKILTAYFAKHNSPLKNHSQDFIDAAKKYNLDWKLVPAIAGVESTFGKFIPGGFNGWGWGVHGTQAIHFRSWKDGIFTVSQGLREKYINKGLTEPYSMNRIYAASPAWGGKVTYFMNDLEKFAESFGPSETDLTEASLAPQTAVNSGTLVAKN